MCVCVSVSPTVYTPINPVAETIGHLITYNLIRSFIRNVGCLNLRTFYTKGFFNLHKVNNLIILDLEGLLDPKTLYCLTI